MKDGMEEKLSRANLDAPRRRGRIVSALVGVFLVFVTTRGLVLWWEYDHALTEAQRRADSLANVLGAHLDRTFGSIRSALNQLAATGDRFGGPQAGQDFWLPVLTATLSGLEGIGSLNVLDADGQVIASTNPAMVGRSRRDFYLHKRTKEEPNADIVIGPPARSETIGGLSIPVGHPLRDREGRYIGFLAATFQPERMRAFYETVDTGRRGSISVIHPDGQLVFRAPETRESPGSGSVLSSSIGRGERGFLRAPIEQGGDTYLTAWRRLADPPLTVTVSVAQEDALADWYNAVAVMIGSVVLIASLLALAGAWITMSSRAHARVLAERDLADAERNREAEERRRIFETSLDLILVTDRKGRFVRVSPSCSEILGYRPDELVGRSAADFIHQEDLDPTRNEMRMARRGERVRNFETRYIHKDGHIVPLAWSGVWSEPEQRHFFIGRDMTERIKLEQQLRQSQKLEAIGQLTGGIAHDFNNILTVVMGSIEVIAEGVADRPALAATAKLIIDAADRGAELTSHLLAFARKQPLRPREISVEMIVGNAQKLMLPLVGEQIEVETHFEKDAWPALVDPTQLTTALLNMAANARDAMPAGGKLTLETRNVVFDQDYADAHSDVAPGDYVMIAVSDTGMGIPQAIREKVFEPFFSTKEPGKGTGLGLSMVYGFVKQSGGHVNIYSEEGLGTSIRIYLPRAGAQPKPAEARPAPVLLGGEEAVLVVEDDAPVRSYVTALLKSLGYRTLPAVDAVEALAIVDRGERFDLLFTDVILSGPMNGRELADAIAGRRGVIKVLFTSGYSESAIIHHGRLDPGVLLLAKPYRNADLARLVRAALDGAAFVPSAGDRPLAADKSSGHRRTG
jgi:PAS domain S-box-containing protein